MRPDNNRSLDWEEITLDAVTMRGTFKLDQHKNVNKGIKARGSFAFKIVKQMALFAWNIRDMHCYHVFREL